MCHRTHSECSVIPSNSVGFRLFHFPRNFSTAWGSETRIRSRRGGVVLVDEPAEQVPPANIAWADQDREGDRGFSQR
jgi:hypothetical protein